MAFLLR